jgi:hypothetical protein
MLLTSHSPSFAACLFRIRIRKRSLAALISQTKEETGQARGHLEDRSECPSPNRKRPSTSLIIKSGGMDARTNLRGKAATNSHSPVEEDGGGSEQGASKPSHVTAVGARTGSSADREVVQARAPTLCKVPCGWMRVKVLERDCHSPNPHCKDSVSHRLDVQNQLAQLKKWSVLKTCRFVRSPASRGSPKSEALERSRQCMHHK